MRRKTEEPTLDTVLKLFSHKLGEFKGESKRSYKKAFSSFQIYVIGNFPISTHFDSLIVRNWLVDLYLQGLTKKTVSFYLDKVGSLYSSIAHKLIGGKQDFIKEIKKDVKAYEFTNVLSSEIIEVADKIRYHHESGLNHNLIPLNEDDVNMCLTWGCMALKAGILPSDVKNCLRVVPPALGVLNICPNYDLTEEQKKSIESRVQEYLKGELEQWFAMRLRPKVKFENLLERLAALDDSVKIPELFYPFKDISRMVGGKLVWEGKPVIRDVVFFKYKKSEILQLFSHIYDLAWCYRNPGMKSGNYAVIPTQAMHDFKNALGILGPGFDVKPMGEMEFNPGDEVVIVNGDYANVHARIIKESVENEYGNKVFRVTLLDSNGHWDIGIDARLLKKNG